MKKNEIEKYLFRLNEKLKDKDLKGEICMYGGAVMCLVFDARPATKDVDAIFEPAQIIRTGIKEIAKEFNLPEDWLNDGIKGFLVNHEKEILFSWSNLNIYFAKPEYLLAMKSLASRVDATDRDDVIFLINQLDLKSPEDVFNIIEKYYPQNRIKAATQFFIEEIFEKWSQ